MRRSWRITLMMVLIAVSGLTARLNSDASEGAGAQAPPVVAHPLNPEQSSRQLANGIDAVRSVHDFLRKLSPTIRKQPPKEGEDLLAFASKAGVPVPVWAKDAKITYRQRSENLSTHSLSRPGTTTGEGPTVTDRYVWCARVIVHGHDHLGDFGFDVSACIDCWTKGGEEFCVLEWAFF
jgi:hypothetical protein